VLVARAGEVLTQLAGRAAGRPATMSTRPPAGGPGKDRPCSRAFCPGGTPASYGSGKHAGPARSSTGMTTPHDQPAVSGRRRVPVHMR